MVTRADARAAARARILPLDADVLLAHVLGASKESLYAYPESSIDAHEADRFAALVARRERGEPVAYLVGWREFYGLRFAVDGRVLVPRPETELLVDQVRAFAGADTRTVADIGTGSGAIAVALAVHLSRVRLIATDLSADALEVAARNARAHVVDGRIEFRQGDLLAPLTERIDAIAANLPYLRDGVMGDLRGESAALAYEPRSALAAGPDGLAAIRRFVGDLPRVLAAGGAAFLECDPDQVAAIAAMWTGPARAVKDLNGMDRVVVLTAS